MDELCPVCCPDVDPETYVVSWCGVHVPDHSGADDAKVLPLYGVGLLLEGGEDGEQWCHLIHRAVS